MARGLFAGMTDYSHQSFNDILEDLKSGEQLVVELSEQIEKNIKKLEVSGYWNEQPFDFKNIINYSLTHYRTTRQELNSIHAEIQKSVQEHHCNRLNRIAEVGEKIDNRIGKYWHNDYERHKNYEQPEFKIIENIYGDTRDLAVTLLDYNNLSVRLRDFIGKTSYNLESKQSSSFENAKFGDNTVIVVGDNNIVSPTQIKKDDINALEKLLQNNNVSQDDINELKEIVESEEPDIENKRLGDKANGWISKMVNKSLNGSWAIGIGAAGKLLADAIKYYFGLF
ncbi:MAG: hypothetical protein M3015_16715 [Bacteroidota bacterium]|nr:hypothetical protein [Bacteroidota bacterium]